jgi:hypothetical protein
MQGRAPVPEDEDEHDDDGEIGRLRSGKVASNYLTAKITEDTKYGK